jgi:RNA polymerase sigma-70 factor (ECF subfamily)
VLQSKEQQQAFEVLVRDLRPSLYRFCAQMAGSAVEGEDILQEALIKAMQAFPGVGTLSNPKAWLFRIARNSALDFLRRRLRSQSILIEQSEDVIADPVDAIGQREIALLGLRPFMKLSPAERGSVILMDVIGYSLREIAEIMDTTVPAVKAALHRGRQRLRALSGSVEQAEPYSLDAKEHEQLALYVDRFNAHDFDAVRDLLAEDVRLDLAGYLVLTGKGAVSRYFANYAQLPNWRLSLGVVDGYPAVLSFRADVLTNFILLTWQADRISRIRDFIHFPHALELAEVRGLPSHTFPVQ